MDRKKLDNIPNYGTVHKYVSDILSEKKIACKELIQACERFERDLQSPDFDFNPIEAEFVIRIIERTFVHQQGERLDGTPLRGQPFLLER